MNPGHPKDPPATAEEILRRMDGKIEQVEPDVRKLDTIEAELWRNSQM